VPGGTVTGTIVPGGPLTVTVRPFTQAVTDRFASAAVHSCWARSPTPSPAIERFTTGVPGAYTAR
jgi:hypothetical protein